MKHSRAMLLTAVLICMLNADARPAASAEDFQTVRDMAGREIQVPANVRRLVALGPGALRLVAYLLASDLVAGIEQIEKQMTRSCWLRPYAAGLPARFFDLPVVGMGGAGVLPDCERLMMCHPDVIVIIGIETSQVENLQDKTGIPAVILSYGSIGVWRAEAQASLELLGKILNRPERAAELTAYIREVQNEFAVRTKDVAPQSRRRAYFGGIGLKGAQGMESTEAGYMPALIAHAHNVADEPGRTGHLFVDREQIIVWDPDSIFVDIGSRSVLEKDFAAQPGFYKLLRASGTGRFYSILPHNNYNTNLEIALLNAFFIGQCLYPEQFKDINLQAKADELLQTFLAIRAVGAPPAFETIDFPFCGFKNGEQP